MNMLSPQQMIDNPTDADRFINPYTLKEKILRVIWNYVGQVIFRLTFHNWYTVRRALLRLFGCTVGENARIRPSVRIEQPWNLTVGKNVVIGDRANVYCLGKIVIGDNVSISQQAHLCAGSHDFTKRNFPLLRPPITIEDHAWIAADAYVAPNVTVHEGAILGARGAAFKDLEPWTIYGGNPAKALGERPKFDDDADGADA